MISKAKIITYAEARCYPKKKVKKILRKQKKKKKKFVYALLHGKEKMSVIKIAFLMLIFLNLKLKPRHLFFG
jgi:hypothetical protein